MKVIYTLIGHFLLWICMPHLVIAPTVPAVQIVSDMASPMHASDDADARQNYRVLRDAGDLVARISFIDDARERRRASALAAHRLRATAAASISLEHSVLSVLLDMAAALEMYDLPKIIAASERRLELEFAARSYTP